MKLTLKYSVRISEIIEIPPLWGLKEKVDNFKTCGHIREVALGRQEKLKIQNL